MIAPDELFDKIVYYDKWFLAYHLLDHILRQIQLDSASRQICLAFMPVMDGADLQQFSGQIVGLEIFGVTFVPISALSSMPFLLASLVGTSLLSVFKANVW